MENELAKLVMQWIEENDIGDGLDDYGTSRVAFRELGDERDYEQDDEDLYDQLQGKKRKFCKD